MGAAARGAGAPARPAPFAASTGPRTAQSSWSTPSARTTAPKAKPPLIDPSLPEGRAEQKVDDPRLAVEKPTVVAAPPEPGGLPEGEINGVVIKQLREHRGLSIEELSEATKIRKPYLRAIEEQDFPNMPARVFLRGFLTQIARVLKVDRTRLSEGYLQFVERHGTPGTEGQ